MQGNTATGTNRPGHPRDQDPIDAGNRPWCNADTAGIIGKEASLQLNAKGDPEYNAMLYASDHPERLGEHCSDVLAAGPEHADVL
jgi:hypothetical protein